MERRSKARSPRPRPRIGAREGKGSCDAPGLLDLCALRAAPLAARSFVYRCVGARDHGLGVALLRAAGEGMRYDPFGQEGPRGEARGAGDPPADDLQTRLRSYRISLAARCPCRSRCCASRASGTTSSRERQRPAAPQVRRVDLYAVAVLRGPGKGAFGPDRPSPAGGVVAYNPGRWASRASRNRQPRWGI